MEQLPVASEELESTSITLPKILEQYKVPDEHLQSPEMAEDFIRGVAEDMIQHGIPNSIQEWEERGIQVSLVSLSPEVDGTASRRGDVGTAYVAVRLWNKPERLQRVIAHEVAHMLLNPNWRGGRLNWTRVEEERLCDVFAGLLLDKD